MEQKNVFASDKKVKVELSRVALIFVILGALCILVWTFILGVWVGTKIGGKPHEEEIAMQKQEVKPLTPEPQNQTAVVSENATLTNQTEATNATAEAPKAIEEKEKPKPQEEKKVSPPKEVAHKEVKAKATPKEPAHKETVKKEAAKPQYTKKEVAQLATKIAEKGYFIQIGAFSEKAKAELLKEKAQKQGFTARIKEVSSEGKTLYKVLIGGYTNRGDAEKVVDSVKEKLGIEKPFIVEL